MLLVLHRICLPCKTPPIHIEHPPAHDAGGVSGVQRLDVKAAFAGDVLLDEAQALAVLLEARLR